MKFYKEDLVLIKDELNIVNQCVGRVTGVFKNGQICQVITDAPQGSWLLKPEKLELVRRSKLSKRKITNE